ncbi:UDP-N-acetylmuramoyl-tripeptide--D-alanyl-D-alanine ligase [Shouchella lonarensis]|uniref:UDP-N-acetylmuramoyl-tripeptide--D-alanyl-D-alanine ligase n=1 Tax=Shouchella lonarensis TaxID=1464122 RepID=A0A1G6HSC0_9BACI|nr:UDP-N-acetylmuramoyl-tripeptide--D-alanyl-D-alanine ligase [Shouchella lonarensis]SDB97179.1 UDP-N-acetylmuramoyl-tripeptide--D-alanyl-D-alanine ligase [Shouchella lonarensis]
MIRRNLQDVAAMLKATASHSVGTTITGVAIDSRKVVPGNLFIPLQGNHSDGHAYIEQAIENGASAALWQKDATNAPTDFPLILVEDTLKALQQLAYAYRNQLKATFIGITGSNGKTTTKDMITNILATAYKVGKTAGNYNNEIGVPLTLLDLDEDVEMAVIEMGMGRPGDIRFLTDIVQPHIGIITNIGHAHIVNLGSLENIAAAKMELVAGIQPEGILLWNGDQPVLKEQVDKHDLRTKTFGAAPTNDFHVKNVSPYEGGSHMTISDSPFIFDVPFPGYHQAMNALTAIALARLVHLTDEHIQSGLHTPIPADKRNDVRTIGHITILDDTYKSNPESVRAALQTLYSIKTEAKKFFIMGDMIDMGDEAIQLHQQVADECTPEQLDGVFGLGELTSYTILAAEKTFGTAKARHFDQEESLMKHLRSLTNEPCILLFKASRALQFERLVEALEESLQR